VSLTDTYRGLRVLDLSAYLAGPFASMILGDMGADVVKIERPPAGDETRALPPRWGEDATVFFSVNRNKRSVLLDFRTPEGREALMRLVRGADVLVESFPPGVAEKLSLRFEDLRQGNPRLVVCSISAFGDGPIGAGMPGFDALVQAVSGLMSFTGDADSAPVRLAPSVLDLTTGMWGAMGIMAALARRAQGGAGEHVRPSLIDSAFAMMSHQVLGYLATGELPRKLGTGAPSAMPYRVYEAADGSFMLATASDAQFVRLCAVLGVEALAQDARFSTMAARLAARDTLDTLLSDIFRQQPVSMWLQRLAQAGIASGPVNDIRQSLALPVVAERDLLVAPERTGWKGGMAQLRLPIDPGGAGLVSPPPRLGQHTEEVLREAGFDHETIARLNRRHATNQTT
jgi:crotonobetainyl-CoA:carnitine CoA-transferase CaiB-like acyl-CoA transferase